MNRKLMIGLAAAALVVMLAGCGKNADVSTGTGAGTGGSSTSGPASSGGTSGSGGSSSSGGSAGSGGSSATAGGGSGGSAPTGQPAGPVNLGPLQVGETAQVGPLAVTLKQVNAVDQAPAPGYTYLLVEMSVQNNADVDYTVNITDHYKAETPEGKKAAYNIQATSTRDPRLQGTLKNGDTANGWVGHLAKRMDGTYKYIFIHPDYGQATWEFGL